jgi:hypothetical protein
MARRRGLGVISLSSVVVLFEELEIDVVIVAPELKGGELGGSSVGGVLVSISLLDVCGWRSLGEGADWRLRGGPIERKIGTVARIASCSC